MPIDKITAKRLIMDATTRVLTTWGAHIPPAFQVAPASLFVLHTTEASIRVPFTDAWDSLFKATFQSTETATTLAAPGGFVTPERNRPARKIHLNLAAAEFDWTGLIAHEYIHWLSHENFFPGFFRIEPDKVEGATDYLMLKCFRGYGDGLTPPALARYRQVCMDDGVTHLKKTKRAVYDWKGQFTNMRAWVKSAPGNEAALADFVFNGVPIAFPY